MIVQNNYREVFSYNRNDNHHYLFLNPPNPEVTICPKHNGSKVFENHSNIGIHRIALAENSRMSTHMPGFQSFLRYFASFCIGQISHQQLKGLIYRFSLDTCICLTLPMLRLLSFQHKNSKIFENHLNPVILVLIWKLSLSTLRWVPICQRSSHFSGF